MFGLSCGWWMHGGLVMVRMRMVRMRMMMVRMRMMMMIGEVMGLGVGIKCGEGRFFVCLFICLIDR